MHTSDSVTGVYTCIPDDSVTGIYIYIHAYQMTV